MVSQNRYRWRVREATDRQRLRARIVEVAAQRLRQDGPGSVTTRGVADAAGVQAPTIYRLFGDKDGLLEAVAEHMMATYADAKAESVDLAAAVGVDPIEDLRAAWTLQIEFGLTNPAVFRLLSDPDRVARSAAAATGRRVLETRVHRIAALGRLRVDEARAVDLIQAAGIGTIQTLLAAPPDRRDPDLADAMLDAVLSRILLGAAEAVDPTPVAIAVAFRALAPRLDALTGRERELLLEWTDRAIRALR